MRATTLLETQHRKVEAMFRRLEAGAPDSAQIVKDLATAIASHMVIEEEIFYPEARKARNDLIPKNVEEHEAAVCIMRRLLASQPGDEGFTARLKVLKEIIGKHVRAEERQLFPAVARTLGEAQNEALGRKMEARFQALMKVGAEGALAARASVAAQPASQKQPPSAKQPAT